MSDVLSDQNVLRVSAAAGAMPPVLSDAYKEIARLRAENERLRERNAELRARLEARRAFDEGGAP